ncbi:DNA helicase PcrA [Salinicoccus jeotgali]|uniref:ATP-dependent DNA helicase n=1 Tax=Salinicoccus jeotgali TaxID=381634 RepID=A0ABP7E3V5_9STAP
MDLSLMNKEQKKAIKTTEGPLLIMAGAGSGKTRVLTHRITYLLGEKEVPSRNILAITFTNKAAREMKERVAALVGGGAASMWISTFHSMCVRILRSNINYIGYENSFSILDPTDQKSVIKDILKRRNLDVKQHNPRNIIGYISDKKNQLIKPDQAISEAASYPDTLYSEMYSDYQRILYRNSALDFDDLIMLTIELFDKEPKVLEHYQNRFQYIHVDEYQDTNHAQYRLISQLAEKYRNICVVGDSDQSIYKFRGADISNILNFEDDYPEATVITLEQNYRSSKNILDAANAVIENNTERKPKALRTARDGGPKLQLMVSDSERGEAETIIGNIQSLSGEHSYSDMAVLYRTNAQSRAIEDALVKSNIPYKMVGGMKFYDRKEIKDLMSYLKVILNPNDDISFERIVNTPKRGLGPKTIDKLKAHGQNTGISIFEAIKESDFIGIPKTAVVKLMGLVDLLESLKHKSRFLTITELVDEVLKHSGYRKMLEGEKSIEATSRLENLEEFKTVTMEFDRDNEISDELLFTFLSDMALVSDQDSVEDDSGVTLMTMHASKGLEFKVVFVVGLEEGIFPSRRVAYDDRELEEERRLMYVALTRAEDRLFLSRANSRMIFGKTESNIQSRFLSEIPERLVEGNEAVGGSASGGMKKRSGKPKRSRVLTNNSGVTFSIGDKVEHKKFGDGIISGIKGEGDSQELDIVFTKAGVKRLLANFAPIEKKE